MDGNTPETTPPIIGEPPLGPPKLELVPTPPAEVTVPAEIQESVDATRAANEQAAAERLANVPAMPEPPVVEGAPTTDATAEAAQRVNGMTPEAQITNPARVPETLPEGASGVVRLPGGTITSVPGGMPLPAPTSNPETPQV